MIASWVILLSYLPGILLAGYPPSNCCPNKFPFLPAPPGKTPPCAKYGATYCEKIDTYPTEVIRYLLYKWGRTYEQFIKSETDQDFFLVSQTYGYGTYGGGYELSSYQPNHNYSGGYVEPAIDPNSYYGQPPPPPHGQQYQPNQQSYNNNQYQQQQQQSSQQSYQTNPPSQYQNPNNYQPSNSYQLPPQQQQQQQQNTQQSMHYAAITPIVQSYWWTHRDSNGASYPYLEQHRLRVRRQAADADQMCQVRNQYITPKAAMNGDGNWMYVVNMDEDKRFVQQVKTEVCVGPEGPCRNVCSFPPGYRASCRQKYVQKRLMALAGTGDRLMTDVFWFPHCCICQFSTT